LVRVVGWLQVVRVVGWFQTYMDRMIKMQLM
jgi:hypothetical protein